jgi:hypothetical protein
LKKLERLKERITEMFKWEGKERDFGGGVGNYLNSFFCGGKME